MNAIIRASIALLVLVGPAFAAQIYGTLREGNRPLVGYDVSIICENKSHSKGLATTDSTGLYRTYISENGKCTLQFSYKGQSVTTDIYSFGDPTRYDYDLVQRNGTYVLQRR